MFTFFLPTCFSPGATQPTVVVYFTALYRVLDSSRTRLLDHTQRRARVGRTPLNEWSVRRRDLYLTTHNTQDKHLCPGWDSNPRSQQASGRRPTPFASKITSVYRCFPNKDPPLMLSCLSRPTWRSKSQLIIRVYELSHQTVNCYKGNCTAGQLHLEQTWLPKETMHQSHHWSCWLVMSSFIHSFIRLS
jgi:hypothetical protein